LSGFKVPTVIELVAETELPMLPTDKVDRQALVELLAVKLILPAAKNVINVSDPALRLPEG
jgi:hypothetical protein